MEYEDLKEGTVYVNKEGEFCQIKEITTYWNASSNQPAYLVCSDDCEFYSDAKTSVGRKVVSATVFIELWSEAHGEAPKPKKLVIAKTEDLALASDEVVKFLKERFLSSADRVSILKIASEMATNEYLNEQQRK